MIVIVDYGMGNLRSVSKALDHIGASNIISSDPREIIAAHRLVLPGVGAFGECVRGLRSRGLEAPVKEFIATGRPFLGICVGMQILAGSSEESPDEHGMDLVQGCVPRFKHDLKIPHMGWNNVRILNGSPLFAGIKDQSFFYFVHSYYVSPHGGDAGVTCASCDYGVTFPAALHKDNVHAVQFHPEKSQTSGLKLLENFSKL